MFDTDPAVLDADATLTDVVAARAVAEAAEVRILCDAAHWADLHHHLDHIGGVSLPGMEQLVCFGGDGTPVVAEFARPSSVPCWPCRLTGRHRKFVGGDGRPGQ